MRASPANFFERACWQVRSEPPLSPEAERALARRWRERRDRAAAEALVRSQLPLVQRLARRFRGYGVPVEELVAEGNVGLLRAVEKFELRGVRFKTYATYWVRAHMLAHVLKSHSIVTRATGALGAQLFFKLRAARARLEARLGAGSDDIDGLLAEQFGVSEELIRAHTARLAQADQSLDVPLTEEGLTTPLDLLPSPDAGPEETVAATEQDEAVSQVLRGLWASLDPRERALVTRRLMVDEEEAETLAELGASFGLSRERLRQLEVKVRGVLRRALAVPENGVAAMQNG